MALSANQLFLARDRVRNVLEAHLESQLALERANNIAQALVFEVEDPVEVASASSRVYKRRFTPRRTPILRTHRVAIAKSEK
jgi:hypothetical protein